MTTSEFSNKLLKTYSFGLKSPFKIHVYLAVRNSLIESFKFIENIINKMNNNQKHRTNPNSLFFKLNKLHKALFIENIRLVIHYYHSKRKQIPHNVSLLTVLKQYVPIDKIYQQELFHFNQSAKTKMWDLTKYNKSHQKNPKSLIWIINHLIFPEYLNKFTKNMNPSCAMCNNPKTKQCKGCLNKYYCCTDCAKKNWKSHKSSCKVVQSLKSIHPQFNALKSLK